jgi:hypothetical protein
MRHGVKDVLRASGSARVRTLRGLAVQIVLLYSIIIVVPLGLGLWLLVMPVRGGRFLHDAFPIFPNVDEKEWLWQVFYRLLGVVFIGMGTFYLVSSYRGAVNATTR